MRHASLIVAAAAALGLGGCVSASSCCDPCAPIVGASASLPSPTSAPTPVPTPTPPAPARAFALYDGTGAPSSLEAFLAASKDADLVAFGELHGHLVGAEMQRKVLEAMAAGPRPVALALEFVERDVQGALDAYLAGRIPEAEFVKTARQGPAYATTHRPLVEFAKARRLAVIAANAPRRLVTPFRKADTTYAEYLASLPEADRGFLPVRATIATGPYLERFTKLMGDERGARLIRGQSLWDDAMAEAVASHRAAFPDARVLLIVGGFHVAGRLGTITKYTSRRPDDRVAVLVMTHGQSPALAFDPEDRGEGDAILVVVPQPPPAAPAKPAPPAPASVPNPKP
jgi:uncharacterized iron-regulated protein